MYWPKVNQGNIFHQKFQNNKHMKRIFTLLLLTSTFKSVAQEDIIPISANGVWIEGSGNWDPFGNFIYNTPAGLAVTDTVNVNDTLYLQFSGFEYCTGGTVFGQTFLLREDSGRYFHRLNDSVNETLWFDFTLEVGDTILLEHCYPVSQDLEQLTVIDIQMTTLSNGSERKKWTLQYSNNLSGFYLMTEEWIEGIGNVQQGWRHPTAQTCIDIGHWLRCYYENEEWVESFEFIAPGTTCCNIVNVLELNKSEIVIYPNPASTQLTIQGSYPILSIEISDPTGRMVFHSQPNTHQTEVATDSLSRGCYFLSVTTKKGNTETLKFLKD